MGEHAHSLRVQNQTEFLMCHKVTQKQQTAATIPEDDTGYWEHGCSYVVPDCRSGR